MDKQSVEVRESQERIHKKNSFTNATQEGTSNINL